MRGNTALRVIIALGLLSFVGLYLASAALKKSLKPNELERVTVRERYSPFDRNRAMADLRFIMDLGPRVSGSPAAETLRGYLVRELRAAGLEPGVEPADSAGGTGTSPLVNVTAICPGPKPGILILGTHYDTFSPESGAFAGANAAAAGTAWLLEFARTFDPRWNGRTICFVWFDGHDGPVADKGGALPLNGSRAFVESLRARGLLDEVCAMIEVSAVGDCYLGLFRDQAAPAWLTGLVWERAENLGYSAHFSATALARTGDATSFRDAGLPALALLDGSYGGSSLEHARYWRTAGDTIDLICPESLQAVADVLYHAFPAIDAYLDTPPEGRK